MSGELAILPDKDLHVAVLLLRFCVGPRLSLAPLSTAPPGELAERNDRLTLNTVDRMVHGFGPQQSSTLRRQVGSQISFLTGAGVWASRSD